MSDDNSEANKWQRRYEREKAARKQAEALLEEKSSQLYIANTQLEKKVLIESSKLKREEEKFTALFHYSKDGIIIHTDEGEIIDINQTACELLKLSREQLIKAPISSIYTEDALPLYKSILKEVQEKGNARYQSKIQDAKKCKIPVDVSTTRFQVGDKYITQSIIRDITESRTAAKALEVATNTAIKANDAKSLFLATMSHEIRTPLNGIIGFTDLLLQSEISEEQSQHLSLIKKSGDILLHIINDILDFSRIESTQIELEQVDFNLIEIIEDTLDIHAQTASAKQVDLVYFVDSDVPEYIHGDSGRLGQILLNLVSNGLKFTEHGAVSIQVTKLKTEYLQFSIRDTGIGFDETIKEQLFQPFLQADASTTRKYGGTGLGLAICRQLIEVMGGSITATSTPGKGSEFTINLPITAAKSQYNKDQALQHELQGTKVFILDDNLINLKFMQARLEKWGCIITTAAHPHEALRILDQSLDSFSMLLVDMLMPEMDGFHFAREINHRHPHSKVPLLLITSSREVKKSCAIKAGFANLIFKPIKANILQRSMLTILDHDHQSLTKTPSEGTANSPQQLKNYALIVEDNHINAKLAKLLVERLGITAHVAHNGEEALTALNAKSIYDIIFMDMQMPVMDGLVATQKIRNGETNHSYKQIPIIAMTANVLPEDEAKCSEAGMNGYITKPIDVEKIEEYLKFYKII